LFGLARENFIVAAYQILSRKKFSGVYKQSPKYVRALMRVCAEEAGDAGLIKDFTFTDIREKDFKWIPTRTEDLISDEKTLSQMRMLREEIDSLERQEVIFREKEFHFKEQLMQLEEKLRKQEELNSEQFQEKIEGKVSDFVKDAQESLEKKEREFSKKSDKWGCIGNAAMAAAILSACGSLWYGAEQFDKASGTDKIEWLFFGYLLLKGLIVISLFAALAKHCYTISNAYMHESLKRSDRMHAINFGKFYLEVYGNEVSQVDMKAAFENWNLDSDSAFVKIKPASLEPKVIGQVAQIFDSISKSAVERNSKAGA
jgi:hypothetical protein